MPLLLLLLVMILQWKKKTAGKIANPALLKALIASYSPARFILRFILLLVAIASIVLAAANLQQPGEPDTINRKGVDVMIALDVSNSMLAADLKPNRLERARQFMIRLIEGMPNDRVGLIVFAGRAYMQMPLSTDHAAAKMYIQTASPEMVPTQGTVFNEALRIAAGSFNSKEKKYKAVVLISDGEDHDAEAAKLAVTMAENGIMINTVGIGSTQGTPIIDANTGDTKKDAQGNIVLTKLNEGALQQLSAATNGVYVRLEDAAAAVKQITAQLATIEQSAGKDQSFINYKNYFQWFLVAALILLITEYLLPERKKIKLA